VTEVSFESLGGGRFRVAGTLDFDTVPGVWEQSRAALDDAAHISIDLGGVTEVDSAGLALVIEWLRTVRGRGAQLTFAGVPDKLRALARISEVEDLMD
jgi:phospholipid transport system transporter-binding protein